MPRWAWTCLSSFRISASVVTSSAVVGSSAINSSGSPARAAARATRWRMPPESWNGYRRQASGSAMPTSTSLRWASARAADFEGRSWPRERRTSSICLPARETGFSIVNGSWKSMDTWEPRTSAICLEDREKISLPRNPTDPEDRTPVGSNRIMARALSDFPLPDSPTMPTVSALLTSRSIPVTIGLTAGRRPGTPLPGHGRSADYPGRRRTAIGHHEQISRSGRTPSRLSN